MRHLIFALSCGCATALALSLVKATAQSPAGYAGSRYQEVWEVISHDPYAQLPFYRVTVDTFFDWFEDRLLGASRRTLNDQSDVLPPFRKLVHPTGICMAGIWKVTEDSPYTGYFSRGSEGLIILRASTALGETRTGQARVFGLAGKLYPTVDPEHAEPLVPANFFTIENLGGTYTEHFLDAANTNDILFILPRPGALWEGPLGAVAVRAFTAAEQTLDVTQPFIRQLYPIAQLGLPASQQANAPRWMKIVGSPDVPRVRAGDYREELELANYPDGLSFEIQVADLGTRLGPKWWWRIGEIEIFETVASEGCDHRLHFPHPPFRHDAP